MPHAAEVRCRSWPAAPTVSSSMTSPAFVARCPACFRLRGFIAWRPAAGARDFRFWSRPERSRSSSRTCKCPSWTAWAFLEAVRQRFPDSSVIMLSGMSETTTAVDCLHLGAADFLLKPISLSELQARVSPGAGEAGAGAAEPVLPAASGATGPGPGHADPGAVSPGSADAGPSTRGQGRLYPGTLDPGEPVRCRHRGAAGIRPGRDWTGSGWEGSCTTSGRSGPGEAVLHKAGIADRRKSSARSPSTRRWESECCPRWRTSHPMCSGSCARITSGWTARDFPTVLRGEKIPDRSAHRRGRRLRSTP